jgi:AcrR family transcriptional regulator
LDDINDGGPGLRQAFFDQSDEIMPKQIDHDAHREDLARRAAPLFSKHGYSGLGLRAIAEALGLSKSALYHYFPTKRDLFLACTAQVVAPPEAPLPPGDSAANRLMAWAEELRPVFGAELALLFDYLRGMDPEEVAVDPAMRLALDRFEAQAERLAPGHGRAALALVTGALLMNHFSGGRRPVAELAPALRALLGERREASTAGQSPPEGA